MRFCCLARGETMSSDSNRRSVTNVETHGNQVSRVSMGFHIYGNPWKHTLPVARGFHGFTYRDTMYDVMVKHLKTVKYAINITIVDIRRLCVDRMSCKPSRSCLHSGSVPSRVL